MIMETTTVIIIATIVILVAVFWNQCETWNDMLRLHNKQKEIIIDLIKTIRDLQKDGWHVTKDN